MDQRAGSEYRGLLLPVLLDQRVIRGITGAHTVHRHTAQVLPDGHRRIPQLLVDLDPGTLCPHCLLGKLDAAHQLIGHLQGRSKLARNIRLIVRRIRNDDPAAGIPGTVQQQIERASGILINDPRFPGNGDDVISLLEIINRHMIQCSGADPLDAAGKRRFLILFQYDSLTGQLNIAVPSV